MQSEIILHNGSSNCKGTDLDESFQRRHSSLQDRVEYHFGLHEAHPLQAARDVTDGRGVFGEHGQESDSPEALDELLLHVACQSPMLHKFVALAVKCLVKSD